MEESLDIRPSSISLIKFALPTIAGSILSNLYSVVDGIFVSGILGTDALSAVNLIMPFLTIMIAVSYMVATGGSAFIACQLGEGKVEEARENFSMLTIVCVGMCVLFILLGIFLRRPIIYFLGADAALYSLCEQYALPLFLSIPFQAFAVIFQMFFVTEGKPTLGMYCSFLGGLANIILDYVFLKLLPLGIAGASLASGIGYSIPSVIGFHYFLIQRKGVLRIVLPIFRFRVLLYMAMNGVSEMVGMLSGSAIFIVMNNMVMRLVGSDGEAAITIILYVHSLLTSLFAGYSMGVAPVISFRYGQKDYEKLKHTHIINLYIISATALLSVALGLLLSKPIVGVFAHENQAVKDMAVKGFYICAAAFPLLGYNVYASSFFTALNDAKTSAILSFCRTVVFFLPLLFILTLKFGLTGLWAATPLSEFCSFLISLMYWIRKQKAYQYE